MVPTALTAEYHRAEPSGCDVARASKFSSRWVPGSSFEPSTSWLVLVAETTMK